MHQFIVITGSIDSSGFALRFCRGRLIRFAIFVQRAQLGQETDQIVQPATQPVHRRRDDPAFVESSPLAVSV